MDQPALAASTPVPFPRRAFDWWLAQVKHVLPPTIFFFVGFNRHSSREADEQSGAIRRGVGGAKGGDQGECGPPSTCRTQCRISVSQGVGSHTAACCRHYPRREPYAGKPHVRIWAGARGNSRPYRERYILLRCMSPPASIDFEFIGRVRK
jgi:hypothetical protein